MIFSFYCRGSALTLLQVLNYVSWKVIWFIEVMFLSKEDSFMVVQLYCMFCAYPVVTSYYNFGFDAFRGSYVDVSQSDCIFFGNGYTLWEWTDLLGGSV